MSSWKTFLLYFCNLLQPAFAFFSHPPFFDPGMAYIKTIKIRYKIKNKKLFHSQNLCTHLYIT